MKTSDFDYDLPEELIAQHPLEKRDSSRLLTLDKHTGAIEHHHFYELPQFLRPGDCLVLNDSRVLPARLIGHRLPGGGVCEVLLLVDKGEGLWECLVRPGRKMRAGAQLSFGEGELTATVEAEIEDGKRLVRFHYEGIFLEVLERLGKMPLPPYIKEELQDQERYQTVYSFAAEDGTMTERSGWTNIFIYPGYRFKVLDALVTNFHLPQSTLVMLVSALAGREHVLAAYEEAVKEKYRFFSFGDAMFIS